ncbi:hypothetical protein [Catenulispora pinistramenti]|uniref:hypothetical protein n=1 Tax=Catenulispora pinistramenti TaxID=2705254 RepID=UPI002E795321|nr:hypothetical protein [Catenulispora pinistramenti]
MRRPPDIGAFLAQHSDARVIGRVPAMFGIAVSQAEAEFQQRLLAAGYSGSYLALLGLAATLTFDAGEYFPAGDASRRDQGEWHGYHRGLQTSLACLVMHETGCNPRQAALLVAEHTEALIRCRWTNQPVEDQPSKDQPAEDQPPKGGG